MYIHKCIRYSAERNTNLAIYFPVEAYNLLKLKIESRMGKGHIQASFHC